MVIKMSESMVTRYLEAATADMIRNNKTEIRCPCRKCKLKSLIKPSSGVLENHLLMRGFMPGYNRWISDEDDDDGNNGAAGNEERQQDNNDEGEQEDEEPPGHDHEGDGGHGHHAEDGGHGHHEEDGGEDDDTQSLLTSALRDPHVQELLLKETSNAKAAAREKAKLAQLEIDGNTPLYEGCRPEDTRLSITLKALEMKARHKWTDVSFDDNIGFWRDRLPTGNTCPTTVEEAKKIVCPLDLPHVKYHACINDCIIYRGEDTDRTTCPVCGHARYKRGKKAPRKVVWYFPITPRLQRYFVDPKEAKLMRWHAERQKPEYDPDKDKMLTHPSDACQWNALDIEFPLFGDDPRNIRLGMSTDGLNPYGNQSSTHSTWPVFVWPYNLPPGCARRGGTYT